MRKGRAGLMHPCFTPQPRHPVNRHLDWLLARNLRPATIDQRRRAIGRLRQAVGDPLLAEREAVEAWYAALVLRVTPEGRACELSHVRGFFKWALLEGLIEVDPTVRLARPKLGVRLPNPIPDDELITALAESEGRVRVWLHLAAYAGLRCYDISRLRGECLRFTGVTPMLLLEDQKGGGMASVPAPPVLVHELRDLPRRGWLFPRHDGGPGPLPAYRVSQIGNQFLHRQGSHHTMHSLRHWYGTKVYAACHDIRQTQELLRHKSLPSTQRYTWVDPGERAGIVLLLPGAMERTDLTA